MKDGVGIIGGADAPTFIFVAKTFLLDAVLMVPVAIAIAFVAMLCVLLFKKRKKTNEHKKDRRKR